MHPFETEGPRTRDAGGGAMTQFESEEAPNLRRWRRRHETAQEPKGGGAADSKRSMRLPIRISVPGTSTTG